MLLVTEKGFMKRVLLIDFDLQARGGKGVRCFNLLKNASNGTYIVTAMEVKEPFNFICRLTGDQTQIFNTDHVKIERRESKGSMYAMCVLGDTVEEVYRG